MPRWEYALLNWRQDGVEVGFTHHESWRTIPSEEFWDVMRRLGDEGWEMLSVLEDLAAERTIYWFKRPRA